jgi:uncharacterized protein YdeI (YjbR/CyaY-like superfamily)
VKAEIRKIIKKQEGDIVHIHLFVEDGSPDVPADINDALKQHRKAKKFFENLAAHNRKAYVDYLNAASNEESRRERIAYILQELHAGRILRP